MLVLTEGELAQEIRRVQEAKVDGAKDERALIVAWLKWMADTLGGNAGTVYRSAANLVEMNEHHIAEEHLRKHGRVP